MSAEVIFGPVGPEHPQYINVLSWINALRRSNRLMDSPEGDPVIVHKGELTEQHEQEVLSKLKPKPAQKQDKPQKARKAGGRWGMLNSFMDTGPLEFTKTQCVVWMYMFRLADGKTNKLLTSVRDIARQTKTAESTVQIAITKLIKKGWLARPYCSTERGTPSQFVVKDGG